MKLLLILFIAGFTGYTKASVYQEVEDIGILQAFGLDFLSNVPYSCPEAIKENVQKERTKAFECVKNIRYNSSFCNTFVHHFKPCVQTVVSEAAKCEDQVKVGQKQVILDSFIAEANFLCETDGEHILELLNPCILTSVKKSAGCQKKVMQYFPTSDPITNLCSKFPSLQKCFDDELKQECDLEVTKRNIHDFFSVEVKPCNIVMPMFLQLAYYF
ncbi:uncharacterized protein LOC123679642 isoform X2 [Harmonia axyridis]|uniref:uncharacterized protein LOC123679642 isoform X1 n=1 Tax=Harmonia axyridis TaxID=115357 RepID=UPI001E27782E|nr:uncharacterized protein LOC123679642 isoform X1 [Harmonia axyridis]XP_045472986.1 uncharacterized protein LOC123679642 isoform X2 [Harmonia axyridis]